MNTELLLLEPLESDLEKELTSYFDLNDGCGVNVTLVWDAMKAVIRGKCISMTSSYLKQKRAYKAYFIDSDSAAGKSTQAHL